MLVDVAVYPNLLLNPNKKRCFTHWITILENIGLAGVAIRKWLRFVLSLGTGKSFESIPLEEGIMGYHANGIFLSIGMPQILIAEEKVTKGARVKVERDKLLRYTGNMEYVASTKGMNM